MAPRRHGLRQLRTLRGHVEAYLGPALRDVKLQRLTPADVNAALRGWETAGVSPALCARLLKTLGGALKVAVRERRVPYNAALDVERPRVPEPERRALSDEEAERLVAAASAHSTMAGALVMVALDTGLRVAELGGLQWGDLDGDVLHVRRQLREEPGERAGEGALIDAPPKARAGVRVVPLTPRALAALAALRASGPAPLPAVPVFTLSGGGRLRQSNLHRRVWQPIREAAGLGDFPFHGLRRTYATRLERARVGREALKALLGHAGPKDVPALYLDTTTLDDLQGAVARLGPTR